MVCIGLTASTHLMHQNDLALHSLRHYSERYGIRGHFLPCPQVTVSRGRQGFGFQVRGHNPVYVSNVEQGMSHAQSVSIGTETEDPCFGRQDSRSTITKYGST